MDCYKCVHRGQSEWSCHSTCNILSPTSSLAIAAMVANGTGIYICAELGVKLHPYGIENGWCLWPVDFDPTWIVGCEYFKTQEEWDALQNNSPERGVGDGKPDADS